MQRLVAADDFLQVKEEDYELVLAKCNVTDKSICDTISSIHDWYKMQHHLPEGGVSDERIFRLLIATGFSLEKTKQKIDSLLTARCLVPEFLMDRDPCAESMTTVRQFVRIAVIPQRLEDMTRILICGFKGEDLSNYVLTDNVKLCLMAVDYIVSSDVCLGDHGIVDWKGFKIGRVTQITPGVIKKIVCVIQGCYGSKLKSVHHTNVPAYVEFVIAILKAGLSDKIGHRMHVHKDYEGLHKCFPKSVLPSDFGGDNKSIDELTDDLLEQVTMRREWYLQQGQLKTDESKRVGVPSAISKELQGLQGSFRKLDID